MPTLNDMYRQTAAIAIRADGRRVQLPVGSGLLEVGPLSLLRILLVGVEDILVLITGSRRENGGSRRIGRR
ncbi:MAG: hypothetical protein L0221_07605 [Chloroflexi bacterium]|nr:hypothetical protein [Chloroflexota bacterium]